MTLKWWELAFCSLQWGWKAFACVTCLRSCHHFIQVKAHCLCACVSCDSHVDPSAETLMLPSPSLYTGVSVTLYWVSGCRGSSFTVLSLPSTNTWKHTKKQKYLDRCSIHIIPCLQFFYLYLHIKNHYFLPNLYRSLIPLTPKPNSEAKNLISPHYDQFKSLFRCMVM